MQSWRVAGGQSVEHRCCWRSGVLLLLVAAETSREMADTEPGGSVASDLRYALAEALVEVYIVTGEILVMGGLIYLLSYLRSSRITVLEAILTGRW